MRRRAGGNDVFFFSLLAGLAEPGPRPVMETPEKSKLKVLIQGQCQMGLERDIQTSQDGRSSRQAGRRQAGRTAHRSTGSQRWSRTLPWVTSV